MEKNFLINTININSNNCVSIGGKQYEVKKTDGDNVFKYEETNGEAIFIKLIFQVQKF